MTEVNWDRLQREAEAAYAEEARRRQKIGDQAREDAERLAHGLRNGQEATDQVADQSVWVYNGAVLLAHLPPSTIFSPVETPQGMALETRLLSPTARQYVPGPTWKPGEWTFAGRGHPGE